jgi:hypothetical protein
MECGSEYNTIVSILRDFSKLCHTCIEEICNNSLKNVIELKMDSPTKRVNSYILFVKQNLISIQERHQCDENCLDKNYASCDSEVGDDSEEDQKMTIEEFHKLTKLFKLKHEKAEKKKKKKKKNKNK